MLYLEIGIALVTFALSIGIGIENKILRSVGDDPLAEAVKNLYFECHSDWARVLRR